MNDHETPLQAALMQASGTGKTWTSGPRRTFAKRAGIPLALALGVLAVGNDVPGASELFGARSAAAANSDVYCRGYAEEAVRRYRDYSRKQCGERVNSVWNPSYYVHVAYCKRVPQTTTEWVKQERYRVLLNDCKPFDRR